MNETIVKFKMLSDEAIIPRFEYEGDAGLDLFSISEIVIKPHETALIRTGIAIELPPGTEAQVRPRSGLALHNSLTVLNSPGTIDCGYRGEIQIILINHGNSAFEVKKHMKIAQMVVKPILHVVTQVVDELSESSRSVNGFGSSGV